MIGSLELYGGRIVTPTGVLEEGRVIVTDGRIAHVGADAGPSVGSGRAIDARDRIVMPGLVDLHGDDLERHRQPRSGARVDLPTALTASDRSNLLAGVTTKFHAVAFEDAPAENRRLDDAVALARELAAETYTLADNRLHARCSLDEESVATLERVSSEFDVDLVSVMDHAPGRGQFGEESFTRHYVEERGWDPDAAAEAGTERAERSAAERTALTARLATLAARVRAPLASHDDETPRGVDRMAEIGTSISEFPVTLAAARRARERGLSVAMGAPNLVRGESLWGNLSARQAVEAGLVDVLCSDYHPPSLLEAAFVETDEPLHVRVNRVTNAPARTVGLQDRGRIESGARADLLVVDPASHPTVERVIVGGRERFHAAPRAPDPVRNHPRFPTAS